MRCASCARQGPFAPPQWRLPVDALLKTGGMSREAQGLLDGLGVDLQAALNQRERMLGMMNLL